MGPPALKRLESHAKPADVAEGVAHRAIVT
jgi:hypothetical protein